MPVATALDPAPVHGAVLGLAVLTGAAVGIGVGMAIRMARTNPTLLMKRAELVSGVIHDLKTPVATIRAAGETLLTRRPVEDDSLLEYSRLIVEQSKRVSRLLDTLLAYSRITDPADGYRFEPLALNGVIDEVMTDFRWRFQNGGFTVEMDVPPELPSVRADRTAIGMLLDTLIENAMSYSRAETRWLRIGARTERRTVALEVSDRGIGIPADELPHVTRRFFRGHRSMATGSGLGLAIAERIANDHHGSLSVHSVVDAGTTVRVTLPVRS